MSAPGSRSRVVAVVPLFEPDLRAAEGIRVLAEQADAVVLVDDGSRTDPADLVAEVGLPTVRLHREPANRGIAHALNRGIDIALDVEGADFVLTVDQDSVLAADYVEVALAAVGELRRLRQSFAAVAAGVVDGRMNRGEPLPRTPFRLSHETIQSGLLYPAASLRALGPFDESFFIDCVDTDHILRGWATGLPTVLAPGCRMQHALGEGIPIVLPLLSRQRQYVVPYHAPVRRYYITRNRIRLVRRHAAGSPRWAVRQTYEQLKYAAADLVWGPAKAQQLLAIGFGIGHALLGRGGRIPQAVAERLALTSPHTRKASASTVHG